MKDIIQKFLGQFGYAITRTGLAGRDMDADFAPIWTAARPYSMTSAANMFSLYKSVEYIVRNDIPGALVECGVWRGGSAMAMALTLQAMRAAPRDIFLFDTFEGMTPPGPEDNLASDGRSAAEIAQEKGGNPDHWIVACAALEEVRTNMFSTGYPRERLHFVQGDVLRTLDQRDTGPLALIRLDTDWYESTKRELEVLFPRLVPGGVLIVDDYGSWQGARKATDDYIADKGLRLLLTRVDGSARLAVKP